MGNCEGGERRTNASATPGKKPSNLREGRKKKRKRQEKGGIGRDGKARIGDR